jgi:hypothetical protein
MKTTIVVAAATLGIALAGSAHAGARLGIEAQGGIMDLTAAKKSAQAVFGSSSSGLFGGALRLDLGNHFFLRAGMGFWHKKGQRVEVATAGGPVFGFGHPLEVHVTPAYFDLGFQLMPHASIRPYLGVGAGFVGYKEESTIAGLVVCGPNPDLSGANGDQDCTSIRKFSSRGLLGVRWGQDHVQIGVEGSYALTPNVLGEGPTGLARIYGETGIGGYSVEGILTIRP